MTQDALNPFHLAFAVTDLAQTERFFVDLLGCAIGRRSTRWIDFNFFGHQVTAHLVEATPDGTPDGVSDKAETNPPDTNAVDTNAVDGNDVPARHFGAILDWAAWHELAARLKAAETQFLIAPRIRFEGEVGEQATMFFLDPSGNALEFKSFKDKTQIFAT